MNMAIQDAIELAAGLCERYGDAANASAVTPLRGSQISGGIRSSQTGCLAFFTPDLPGRRKGRTLFIDCAARGLIELSMTRFTPVGSDAPTAAVEPNSRVNPCPVRVISAVLSVARLLPIFARKPTSLTST
jgi:hypothetical protein